MKKKVKILESNCTPDLEKIINEHLRKGWKLEGGLILGSGALVALIYK